MNNDDDDDNDSINNDTNSETKYSLSFSSISSNEEKIVTLNTNNKLFKCPISHEYLINPVIASDGHIYEKRYIQYWLKRNSTSPLTRENISNRLLICPEFSDLLKSFYNSNPQYKPFDINDMMNRIHHNTYDVSEINKYMHLIDRCNMEKILEYEINKIDVNSLSDELTSIFSNEKFVDFLIDHHPINFKGFHDWMLIHFVCRFGLLESIYKILKMDKIDKEAIASNNFTPLHFICSDQNNLTEAKQYEAICFAVNTKLDFEAETIQLFRPIHFICSLLTKMKGNIQYEAIKLLVNHGVDLNVKNHYNDYPLHFVCSNKTNLYEENQYNAIKLLIKNGANANVGSAFHRQRPIDLLSVMEKTNLKSFWLEAVQLLINSGCGVDSKRMKLSF